jgi:hypothetical protein
LHYGLINKKSVEPSTRKNKKYMILNDDNKYIHFGDSRYQDATVHNDPVRISRYLSRATKIKGNWENVIDKLPYFRCEDYDLKNSITINYFFT